MADPFDSALDLLRRLNPAHTTRNLNNICALRPDLTEDLLSSVDQPLEVRRCKTSGRDYLLCDYNRDGDSWRSPWSNTFDPPVPDGEGTLPSERVRRLEVRMNEGIDVYRELYYEGGASSVYFWDVDDGFAGVVLLKKSVEPGRANAGSWDSIHVFEALDRARMAHYKLTSTVILQLSSEAEALGTLGLSGNLTRQVEQDMPVESDNSHIGNIGKLVEDMESKMRNLLQEVYFGKAKDVVGDLRSITPLSEANRDREAHPSDDVQRKGSGTPLSDDSPVRLPQEPQVPPREESQIQSTFDEAVAECQEHTLNLYLHTQSSSSDDEEEEDDDDVD